MKRKLDVHRKNHEIAIIAYTIIFLITTKKPTTICFLMHCLFFLFLAILARFMQTIQRDIANRDVGLNLLQE